MAVTVHLLERGTHQVLQRRSEPPRSEKRELQRVKTKQYHQTVDTFFILLLLSDNHDWLTFAQDTSGQQKKLTEKPL
eukprot:10013943-Ditylum_brightwellii.AAC.1